MLKAILLDLDETLCDTTGANQQALLKMGEFVERCFAEKVDTAAFQSAYLKGIYRDLDARYARILLPGEDEGAYRLALITLILKDMGIAANVELVAAIQTCFDDARSASFDFFPGVKQWLAKLRRDFRLIVITNGPEFSQVAKVEAVQLKDHVDHIIIGGQEKEQKPAASIFAKALRLADCEADEAIHIGDSLKADIAGANNSGITSIWVSYGKEASDGIVPSHVIEHPREMMGLLESLMLDARS